MNDKIMLFCTCTSKNYQYYLNRVIKWYKQFLNTKFMEFNIDFYTFSDGEITKEMIKECDNDSILSEKIKIISCTPHLDIHGNNNNFLGWKRSMTKALEISKNYKYVMHIESDVVIKNFEKIYQNIFLSKMLVGCANPYHMIDTAFMILNDKEKNEKLYQKFIETENCNTITEILVNELVHPEVMFQGVRYEGHPERLKIYSYDYIGQSY